MSEEVVVEPTIALPPIKIAFIIDNQIVDILHTDERLAAIFLSEPLIIDITGNDGVAIASVGDLYDMNSKTFRSIIVDEE